MISIKADLHLHTNCSDGNFSPEQVIDIVKKSGIGVLSITDHDNINGISKGIEYGKTRDIQVIPGVEISADLDEMEIHILGYFIDIQNKNLSDFLLHSQQQRLVRNEKMVQRLNSLGSNITFRDIQRRAGEGASVGRPHIAIELNNEGFVSSYYDAFIRYIGDGKPAYIKKPNPTAEEVIKIISDSGGLSFIAHPGKLIRDEKLLKLIDYGLDGIEVIHPSHGREDIEYFTSMAAEHFMLTSGGSDFHGGIKNDGKNLGKYHVSMNEVVNMKRRLFT